MKNSFNNYVGVAVALLVAGFMFYGMSYLYSKVISKEGENTMSNVTAELLVEGSGSMAEVGDRVFVNYIGTLANGTKFDSSYDRGVPIDFILGTGAVILGWDQGIAGMKVGEKKRLTIPPELGYGANAVGPIPANSTLVFEVELVKVEKSAK